MAGAKDARTPWPTRPVMAKKQGIHALENSENTNNNTDNQSEFRFYQLEINTLGDAGNNDGTQALVQLKIQSPQCTNQLICKLDTGAEGNVIPLTTYKTMSPHCNVTQDDIPRICIDLTCGSLHMEDIQSHTMAHAIFKLHIEMNQCLLRFML